MTNCNTLLIGTFLSALPGLGLQAAPQQFSQLGHVDCPVTGTGAT